MSDTDGTAAPAGWYEDGQTAGHERYWDGTQWTDQFRPLAPNAVAPETPAEIAVPVAAEFPAASPPPGEFPAYMPLSAAARGPRTPLSKGARIGIIVGAAVVVVAIVVIIVGAATNWFQGSTGG